MNKKFLNFLARKLDNLHWAVIAWLLFMVPIVIVSYLVMKLLRFFEAA